MFGSRFSAKPVATGAAAARGEEPHRSASAGLAEGFVTWAADRLDAPEAQRRPQAIRLLATLDGLFLLHGTGLDVEPALA